MNEYREHALKSREAIRQLKRGARIRRDRMRVAICELALTGRLKYRTVARMRRHHISVFLEQFFTTPESSQSHAIDDCLQLISERGCG